MTEGSVTPELGVEQGQVPFLDKGFNFPLQPLPIKLLSVCHTVLNLHASRALNVRIPVLMEIRVSLINASCSYYGYLEFAEIPRAINFFYRSLRYEL